MKDIALLKINGKSLHVIKCLQFFSSHSCHSGEKKTVLSRNGCVGLFFWLTQIWDSNQIIHKSGFAIILSKTLDQRFKYFLTTEKLRILARYVGGSSYSQIPNIFSKCVNFWSSDSIPLFLHWTLENDIVISIRLAL